MNIMFKLIITAIVTISLSAQAADKAKYEALSKEVMQTIVKGDMSNIDNLISKLNEATLIGVEIAKEVAAKDAAGKPLLDFTIANIEKIKASKGDVIERDWHHGAAYKAAGIEHDKFSHYGAVICAKDTIIHPLTVIALFNEYKVSKKKELLDQAQAEIEEVLGQVKSL